MPPGILGLGHLERAVEDVEEPIGGLSLAHDHLAGRDADAGQVLRGLLQRGRRQAVEERQADEALGARIEVRGRGSARPPGVPTRVASTMATPKPSRTTTGPTSEARMGARKAPSA